MPKGADHGKDGVQAYNGGLGSELPAGSRGKAPLKLKAFCPVSYKREAKR